jgi:tRNA(fMet)-specific endonuclease VapC
MYALDTNTLSYFFKGQGQVAERLLSTPPAEVAIPSVVLFELEFGLARSRHVEERRKQLREFVAAAAILPFGVGEARAAAQVRSDLERQGGVIGPYDLLIAGTALSHGAILVTHNTREFGRVRGLAIEDWYGEAAG